ncbi:MAG: hypothetical protein HC840_00845 [Leptolyngbyaceae cyanobacterium RM2_2_4]|nr:hypothetical protein [Leptolyngbyaceae cyanobacterium RM2_2_4]
MELRDRERKVDISKLSTEAVDNLSTQIGDKVRQICDEAADKVNAILKIYGMSAKMAIKFDTLDQKPNKEPKAPRKRAKR